MEDSYLLQLPQEILSVWHAHRTELLISAGFLLAIVRFTLHWRSTKTKAILTPPLGSPAIEKPIPYPEVVTENSTPIAQPVKTSNVPRRVKGVKKVKKQEQAKDERPPIDKVQPYIFYFTLGGSTKAYAEKLAESFVLPDAEDRVLPPQVHDLTDIDYDDFFISPPKYDSPGTAAFYTILIPSYNIDTELHNFISHLQETHHDFRIDTAPLQTLAGYSVFGFGDMQEWPTEQEGYCVQAIEVDKWMAKLTGKKRAFPLGMGDVKDDVELRLEEWRRGVQTIVDDLSQGNGLGEGVPGSGDAVESGDEADEDYDDGETLITTTADLEDIRAPVPVDFTTSKKPSSTTNGPPKAMVPVNSPTFNSLTKQGYSIIGTHSGVKICRWTKSALRGRGSCYKYSFYGIASHRCMEATPSLSCSNKCVFCWRHGSNPVGTTWRWQVDPPEQIFEGILAAHYKKIKSLRGVPGVRSERFAEAMRVRHCALSLVGEPIFYPHINQLLAMLHAQHISSFLVCNAQHPAHLAALGPVTQLYVSIDASNRDSLRKIDRPLHRDFWERFCDCMDILRAKRYSHRTVFRLTLVKGFNIADEVAGYADLVQRARPGFIEVKGVTYCGTSTSAGAGLSMANVPFWEEVQEFVLALAAELKTRGIDNDGMEYGLAAEHQHSCCVLLADKERFYREDRDGVGRWHTLIDYEKFFKLVERGGAFKAEDYVSDEPTADWAGWGRGGFDPRDVRVDRKGRPIEQKDEGRVVEI